MLYKQRLTQIVVSAVLFVLLAACVPTGNLDVEITGIDDAITYNVFPPVVLDYAASSQAAAAAGESAAFDAQVQSLTVTLNGVNISQHVTFGAETGVIDGLNSQVLSLLNNGQNAISVDDAQTGAIGPISASLDRKAFLYSNVATQIVVTDVVDVGGMKTVEGYVVANNDLVSVTINGDAAVISNQSFSVETAAADEYEIVAVDSAAISSTKNYVATKAFINNAVRTRIHESLITPQALVDAINNLSGTVTIPTEVMALVDPLISFPLFFADITAGIDSELGLDGASFSGLNFVPSVSSGTASVAQPDRARVSVDFSLLGFDAGMYVNIAPVLGDALNLPARINPDAVTVSLELDIYTNAASDLNVEVITTTVDIPNINLTVEGLPTFMQAIINPLIDLVVPAIVSVIEPTILTMINPLLDSLLADIGLGLGIGTGFVDADVRVVGLSSDTGNLYADVQMGFAAPTESVASLGAVASTGTVAFVAPDIATETVALGSSSITLSSLTPAAFAGVDYMIPSTTNGPSNTVSQNFGLVLSSDVINQAVTGALATGILSDITIYTHAGQIIVASDAPGSVPTSFDQLDIRVVAGLTSAPEIMFSGTAAQLNTDVLIPNFELRIDMWVDGAWAPVVYTDVLAEAGAGVGITSDSGTMTVALIVDEDSFKFTLTNRQLGEDTLDYDWGALIDLALLYIKPQIANVLNTVGQLDIAIPESAALSNVTVGANGPGMDHIEIGLQLDFFSLLLP